MIRNRSVIFPICLDRRSSHKTVHSLYIFHGRALRCGASLPLGGEIFANLRCRKTVFIGSHMNGVNRVVPSINAIALSGAQADEPVTLDNVFVRIHAAAPIHIPVLMVDRSQRNRKETAHDR